MTYPQQGFVPQPQFAPQQAPQQFQPQQAPQAAPAAVPALNPAAWAVGAAQDAGGNGVAMAHLNGRTVAIIPLEHLRDQPIKNDASKVQDVIRADIFILDGGPFVFGGSPEGKPIKPDTQIVNALPFLAENCRLYGKVIVSQLSGKVRQGVSVGKVGKMMTGSGNEAWCLSTDATQEQLALAGQLVTAHYQHRSFQNPPVMPLAPQPQAPQYAPAPIQPGLQYAPQPQWPTPQPGVVAQPMQYGPPQEAPYGQPSVHTPPAQPQFGQPPAPPQFGGFAPSAPPAEDWTLNTMPPNVPADQLHLWQTTTTREAREQMLAAAGITGPGQVNPGRPTGL